jgi:hypothetical protein
MIQNNMSVLSLRTVGFSQGAAKSHDTPSLVFGSSEKMENIARGIFTGMGAKKEARRKNR